MTWQLIGNIAGPPGSPGKDGSDGAAGKDADLSVIAELKAEMVALRTEMTETVTKAVAALPIPQNGTSVTVDDVAPLIAAEVSKAIGAIPPPRDGVGMVGALIDRAGHLVVTLSDGATKDVGSVMGRDVEMSEVTNAIRDEVAKFPRPQDGKDGLGFDDLSVIHDGERGITFRFMKGDVVKDFTFTLPMLIYRGVYAEGKLYSTGDVVTWAGSTWHAKEMTSTKPGDGSKAWTLVVKRGRDGKDGMNAPGALPVLRSQ